MSGMQIINPCLRGSSRTRVDDKRILLNTHNIFTHIYIYIGSNIYFDFVRDVCFCMIYDGIIDLNRGLDMDMVQQSSG